MLRHRVVAALAALLVLVAAASAQGPRLLPPGAGPLVFDQSYSTIGSLTSPSALSIASPGVLTGSSASTGAFIVSNPSHGTAHIGTDGSMTYTPDAAFFGEDTFTFSASGASNTATVTMSVSAPVSDKLFQVPPGGAFDLGSPGVLPSTAGGETAVLQTGPSHADSFTLNTDGSFSYIPAINYLSGTDSFTFENVANGVASAPATVTIVIQPTIDLSLNSRTVYTGGSVTGTITLGPLAQNAMSVSLASGNTSVATVTPSVPFVQGARTGSFTVTAAPSVSAPTAVTIYANDGGAYYKTVVTVLPAGLQSFTINSSSVQGGSSFVGVLSAAGSPIVVSFASGNTSVVTAPLVQPAIPGVPLIVPFATSAVAADQLVNVIASSTNSRIQNHILVLAPRVQSLSFGGQTSVSSGNSATLTITLTGPAPTGGTTVTLTGVLDGVTQTAPVTIPAGQSFTTVTETAPPIGEVAVLKVYAKGYAGSAAGTTITVTP